MADDERVAAFLITDYGLKIRYLTDHFSRMWTRFNYFVGVESAIMGGKLIFGDGKLSVPVAILGALVALVWYLMGAEDRFLVEVYRLQVADTAALLARATWSAELPPYCYVGEVDESAKRVRMSASGWRVPAISTTRLAALIPLVVFAGWLGVLLLR